MKLWWRDRIRIWLGTGRIQLKRAARGFSGRITQQRRLDCAPEGWEPTIARLEEVFAGPEWRDADADVILSNRFARFAVLPPSAELLSNTAILRLAAATFVRTHGEAAADWHVAVAPGGPGRSLLAAAIDRELFAALERAASAANVRIRSCRPYFTEAFSIASAASAWPFYWFAALEPELVCAGTVGKAGWQILRSRRWNAALTPEARGAALEALLSQSSVGLDEPQVAAPVHVFAPSGLDVVAPPGTRRSWLRTGARQFSFVVPQGA